MNSRNALSKNNTNDLLIEQHKFSDALQNSSQREVFIRLNLSSDQSQTN